MEQQKKTTIVLFSGDYDKAIWSLILLQMVRDVRSKVTIFHTLGLKCFKER